MCTLCGSPHIRDPLGLCLNCMIELRREYYTGLERLTAYLAAWTAFQDWEADQLVAAS